MPDSNEMSPGQGIRLAGRLLPSLIPLGLKLARRYIGFKMEARKGSKVFRQELLDQGIDPETADAMTELYLEPSRMLKTVGIARFMEWGQN